MEPYPNFVNSVFSLFCFFFFFFLFDEVKFISSFLVNVTCIINFLVFPSFVSLCFEFYIKRKRIKWDWESYHAQGRTGSRNYWLHHDLVGNGYIAEKEKGSQNTEKIAHVCSIIWCIQELKFSKLIVFMSVGRYLYTLIFLLITKESGRNMWTLTPKMVKGLHFAQHTETLVWGLRP